MGKTKDEGRKMKKQKVVYIIFSIFLVIGIGLLAGGAFATWKYSAFMSHAEEVTGEVAGVERYYTSDREVSYHVYVNYTYDGVDYKEVPLNSYSSGMYEGKKIKLYCDVDNPGHIMTSSTGIIVGSILGGMGILFTVVGGIPLIKMKVNSAQKKKVLENGQVIYATVENIVLNTNYSINGQNPYLIYCFYQDSYQNILYRFKSENLWMNPAELFPIGSSIKVYVNPKDYSKYYVDTQEVSGKKIVDYT